MKDKHINYLLGLCRYLETYREAEGISDKALINIGLLTSSFYQALSRLIDTTQFKLITEAAYISLYPQREGTKRMVISYQDYDTKPDSEILSALALIYQALDQGEDSDNDFPGDLLENTLESVMWLMKSIAPCASDSELVDMSKKIAEGLISFDALISTLSTPYSLSVSRDLIEHVITPLLKEQKDNIKDIWLGKDDKGYSYFCFTDTDGFGYSFSTQILTKEMKDKLIESIIK